MSDPGYIDKMYNDQMKCYNTLGENMTYCGNDIFDMDDKQIKKEIHTINDYTNYFNIQNRGWNEIFEDVLYNRRRKRKLNKIINNIK